MPCQFSLSYASSFEPSSTFDPNSENAFGNKCQFTFFEETQMISSDGKEWCPFHLPLTDSSGNSTEKKAWLFFVQAQFGGLLFQYIEERRKQDKPIDLCGLVHWDRLSFPMAYGNDLSDAQTIPYENLPALALDGAHFPRGVDFQTLHFAKPVYARNVFFGNQADFAMTHFSSDADFSGSVFKGDANFFQSRFEKNAIFYGARFQQNLVFASAEFSETADFSLHNLYHSFLPSHPADESIRTALFHHAKFLGHSRFNDRVFLSGPNFQQAQFSVAPEFHNCSFHQSANFDGAKFLDTSSDFADHAYRTLKLAMERLGARDEQAMFFALEQQARVMKPTTSRSVKIFSHLYGILSDYGQSFVRPFIFLALVTAIFGFAYTLNFLFVGNGQPPSFGFVINFTLEQLIRPFSIWAPDSLKKLGIASGMPADPTASELVLKSLSTLHALLSLGLIALALLALRRRFKLD
ncbi:pentapeptide repeat-containing protein [Hydrogenophaga sp. ZJX-1]|uniref:pentapeptide repeat-containing protein n=1 Tax=Hydrogenophaga sp. ZJX-1 TaxID=3404778 RepID=UPI003B28B59B